MKPAIVGKQVHIIKQKIQLDMNVFRNASPLPPSHRIIYVKNGLINPNIKILWQERQEETKYITQRFGYSKPSRRGKTSSCKNVLNLNVLKHFKTSWLGDLWQEKLEEMKWNKDLEKLIGLQAVVVGDRFCINHLKNKEASEHINSVFKNFLSHRKNTRGLIMTEKL